MSIVLGRRAFVGAGLACAAAPLLANGRNNSSLKAPATFSGTLLLARHGRTFHRANFSMADIERGVPVHGTTRFALGSGTKWLTSVAVLKLAEAGKLALDAPIGKYLPELPRATRENVRLEHLLSNTSGIPDLLSEALKSDPSIRTSSDPAIAMAARFGGGPLRFAPGAGFDYSPLNWVLVNAIVTRAATRPFDEALQQLVFAPLGLRTIALANGGWEAVPQMAAAYRGADPPIRKMDRVPAFVSASGNAVGTAEDAMRAAHSVFATRFLRPNSRAQLIKVRWPEQDYALGGRVHLIGNQEWAWEEGKVSGYRALIAQNLARDETIVIFNNRDAEQSALAAWAESIVKTQFT